MNCKALSEDYLVNRFIVTYSYSYSHVLRFSSFCCAVHTPTTSVGHGLNHISGFGSEISVGLKCFIGLKPLKKTLVFFKKKQFDSFIISNTCTFLFLKEYRTKINKIDAHSRKKACWIVD